MRIDIVLDTAIAIITGGFPLAAISIATSDIDASYLANFSDGDYAFWILSNGDLSETIKATLNGSNFDLERGANGSSIIDFPVYAEVCITTSVSSEALDVSDCVYDVLAGEITPDFIVTSGDQCFKISLATLKTLLEIPTITEPDPVDLCALINALSETTDIVSGDKSIITRNGECYLIDEANRCGSENQI